MKKKRIVAVILSLTMMLSGAMATGVYADELDGEIKIGLSCAITGNFPLAGQRTKEGVDLALEEINANGGVLGKKLVYTVEDDQNTQTTAVNVVTKILNEDVCAVIGPHTSGNAAATSELYKNAQIPFLTGGSSPKLAEMDNPYFFRIRPSDTINGQVAAKYAVETLEAKKIGISYNNNDFGTGGRDVVIEALEEAGIDYVAVGHNAGDKDLTGQIMQLISKKNIAENKDKLISNISMKRLGEAEDLAKPIVFLSSDAAGYMSGFDVEITGGKYATQNTDWPWRIKNEREKEKNISNGNQL